jgi:hypothetical protein
MEKKNISVLCPVDLHRRVKMRMLDELGDDNFTRLILGYLESYASNGATSGNLIESSTKPTHKEVSEFERCLAVNPEITLAYLASLQMAIQTLPGESLNANADKVGPNKSPSKGKR